MTNQPALTAVSQEESQKRKYTELMLRVNSALILATVSLLAAYSGPISFSLLISVFITAMAWEWSRLVRGKGIDEALVLQALAIAAAAMLTAFGRIGPAIILVIVATASVFALRRISDDARRAWWSAAGVYYAGFPAIALVWFRTDPTYGWHVILFLFVVVWTTDTAAFAFGRLIGGPKLAPRISPNKTWAGLIGGVGAAMLAGFCFGSGLGGTNPLALGLLGALLSLVAQMGDLAESAFKRLFGWKDSSRLIPGHGGVLDRLDGLVFAAVAAAFLAWMINASHPGAALIKWL